MKWHVYKQAMIESTNSDGIRGNNTRVNISYVCTKHTRKNIITDRDAMAADALPPLKALFTKTIPSNIKRAHPPLTLIKSYHAPF